MNTKHFLMLLTLSCGLIFPAVALEVSIVAPVKVIRQQNYPYSQQQEDILIQIQQLKTEINELKTDKDKLEADIDNFYLNNDYDENSKNFSQEYSKLHYKENKLASLKRQIDEEKAQLEDLQKQWEFNKPDNRPVAEHIVYIERNYGLSPFRLIISNGFIIRRGVPYHYQYREPKARHGVAIPSVSRREDFIHRKSERLRHPQR